MKMVFLVICPGPFQYAGVRERERERKRERGCRKGAEEKIESGTRCANIEKNRKELSLSLERDMLALPSSLSFLISLKERRSIECKRTVILTLAKVSRDVSTCALYPAGRFGIDVQGARRYVQTLSAG